MGRRVDNDIKRIAGVAPAGNGRSAPVVDAPEIEPGIPAVPPVVLSDPVALDHWAEIVPSLADKRVLDVTFVGNLSMLCKAWSEYVDACKRLDGEDLGSDDLESDRRIRRYVALRDSSRHAYMRLSDRFGLDPKNIKGVHSRKKTGRKEKVRL